LSCEVGRNVTQFYEGLCQERRPEIICEKLHMLLTGRYRDVQVFPHGWKMSKQKMNRLSNIYDSFLAGFNWSF